jgi:hypothetical protein
LLVQRGDGYYRVSYSRLRVIIGGITLFTRIVFQKIRMRLRKRGGVEDNG